MSSYFDVLRGDKTKKVRFFNVLSGYLNSENICFDVQYKVGHQVKDKDWIGVFPAGFQKPNQDFAAVKMAPPRRGRKYKNWNEMHKVMFKSVECKLAPRNFYQIAYINSSNKTVATSAIFYIEGEQIMPKQAVIIQNQPEPGILSHLLCSSASWTENTASMALSDDSGMEDDSSDSRNSRDSLKANDDDDDEADESNPLLELRTQEQWQ
ncbi:unnamed protein product [Bursaphelenchus okinawaensis]|uniref:SKICH domain-containing protein n=1 Tax=Bursaphelenchus okinawaensis TaxID=465554 RepID=A0A811LRG9_9BILA|nr:unnamed protein product [Bursaphelenchus okinawaensis]CAG9127131.1 unnamed protein product [Bursaphelenchus okinawaensis]